MIGEKKLLLPQTTIVVTLCEIRPSKIQRADQRDTIQHWELLHHGRRAGEKEMIEIQVVSGETTLIFHIETYQLKNGVVKPKCQQETSLNKMLSNFSKVLIAQISFTAVINNGGIGKGIGGIKKNHIYVL